MKQAKHFSKTGRHTDTVATITEKKIALGRLLARHETPFENAQNSTMTNAKTLYLHFEHRNAIDWGETPEKAIKKHNANIDQTKINYTIECGR